MARVRENFGLHELAVEDAQAFHLRPKVEHFEEAGNYFVILRTARYDDEREAVDFGEISVFIGPGFVITVRQRSATDLHSARVRLEQHPELLSTGTGAVLWAILDRVVDDYAPVVEGLERDIEEVEATVFSGAAAATERIYFLRRQVTDFYRAVHPLLTPFEGLEHGAVPELSPDLLPYYRDVRDHLRLSTTRSPRSVTCLRPCSRPTSR
jgi:magnesium transporter